MDEFLLSHISPTLYEGRGPGEDLSSPNSIEIPVESMSTKVKEREKSLPSALDTNALMLICNTYQERAAYAFIPISVQHRDSSFFPMSEQLRDSSALKSVWYAASPKYAQGLLDHA